MSEEKKNLLDRKKEFVAGDSEKLAEQKKSGKLTARERIAALFDEGSFVEIGALVTSCGDKGEGVVAGYGVIDERPAYVYSQDFTVAGGAVGAVHAAKIQRVMALAKKTGAPLIALFDSNGARLGEGMTAVDGFASIIAGHAGLSGLVPQIALVAGPCVGAAAIAASMCDFVVMTDKISAMLCQGAQVISARTGKAFTPDTLGGAKAADAAGACAYAADNEAEAIDAARRILSFMPSNNIEDAPAYEGEELDRAIDASSSDAAYIASQIADGYDVIELYKGFAPEMYCAFAKLGGYCTGIVANANGGVITPDAAAKAAHLISVCDSFNIPVVSIINTEGFAIEDPADNFAAVQGGAKLAYAYASATVPKVSLITGKAIGGGYAVMGSRAVGADLTYAWPDAQIAPIAIDAGARIIYNDQIKAGMSIEDAEAKYAEENASPFAAAASGSVDDVIAPETTRQYLIAAIDMLYSKREAVSPRKHGNQPL